jgi:hypothetical protein
MSGALHWELSHLPMSARGSEKRCAQHSHWGDELGTSLGAFSPSEVGERLGLDLGELLGDPLGDALGTELGPALGEELGEPLRPPLGDELGLSCGRWFLFVGGVVAS